MKTTNQQLAFARVQVQAADAAESTLARRAHWQACLIQFRLALEAYATELRDAAKLGTPVQGGPRLFSSLAASACAAERDSAELNELAQLERDSQSWLAIFNDWYSKLLTVGVESHQSSVLAETSLTEHLADQERSDSIALVEVTEGDQVPPLDGARLQAVIAEAAALIERQRQNSAEF